MQCPKIKNRKSAIIVRINVKYANYLVLHTVLSGTRGEQIVDIISLTLQFETNAQIWERNPNIF